MNHGITRRRLLALLGAGVAGASMAGTAGADPLAAGRPCRRIPRGGIGMHLYTVRDILAADPLGTLKALAGIGYKCVGVSAFPRPAAEIRDMCAEARLKPVILHVGHGDITGNWAAKLADFRKRNIGFIFQSFNLVDELTVRENIELALLYHDVPSGERRRRVDEVMDKVGIAHRAKHRPSQLSGGQQQRVAVARALVGSPNLILADEPTGNLDTQHGEEVMKMLQALNAEGSTIVMVTHSPAHADYASRVVNMLDGKILIERRRAA